METRSKKEIRAEVKKHRREATAEQIRENSNAICNAFLQLPEYETAKVVFAYMDCKNEVMTRKVIEQCWADDKTVAVPKVFGEVMHYYVIRSYDDLEDGYFGIQERLWSSSV